uniref:Vasohibin n=1 Tax=Phytophthora ramorum TaxID=164328 RepID=H3HE50_PHYRM
MAAISSEELQDAWQKVKAMTILPEPPEPKMPSFGPKVTIKSRLHAVQNVITSLEYNYTGTLYFDVNKNRSFKSIANTAKEIIKEGLPIQCLEAVFLAAYLTAGLQTLERFPISFKTIAGTSTHRHIVLGVRHQQQKWGALGLSRCDKLMNKEMKFDSLSDLVLDYCQEFQNVYHKVVRVNVLNLPVDTNVWTDVAKQLDNFGKDAAEIESFKKAKGEFPAWFGAKYALNAPEVEIGSAVPAPPTNIFLQNTSASPFLIEIEDNSGLLEIVTKSQPAAPPEKTQQSEERDEALKLNTTKCTASVRISARGMIVVAIKYNPHRLGTNKLASVSSSEKSPQSKLLKKGVNENACSVEPTATSEQHQVVSFRCTPTTRSSENLTDAEPDGETFTLETPFVLKDV